MATDLLDQTNWRYLLRKLHENRQFDWMRPLFTPGVIASLEIPVAIARWLEHFHPELAAQPALHVVVGGAELGPDSFDEGTWYQVIPHALGNPGMRLTVSLVGPNARSSTRGGWVPGVTRLDTAVDVDLSAVLAGNVKVEVAEATVGEFLAHCSTPADAVILPHPGFERHADKWLGPCELPAVIARGIPVGCLAYAHSEYEHDRWFLAQYGFSAVRRPALKNPLALEDTDALMYTALADTLWELDPCAPAKGFEVGLEAIQQDRARNSALFDMVGRDGLRMMDAIGTVSARDTDGSPILYVGADMLVQPKTGEVFRVSDDSRKAAHTGTSLPADVMAQRPAEDALPYAHKAWLLDVLLYLLYLADLEDSEEVF
jgi:hypothetical protein